jgi:Ferredoxin-like domain in Api92-like protein
VPGWTYNTLTVKGPHELLRVFKRAVCGAERDPETGRRQVLDFSRHRPMPPEVLTETGGSAPGGQPRWIAWRIENWGTKWNAVSPTLSGTLQSGELRYRFRTAWTPPVEWLQSVAAAHPGLRFELTYEEELGQFRGVLRLEAGRVVEDRCRASFVPRDSGRQPRLQVRSSMASW